MKYCPRCKSPDVHPTLAGFLDTYTCNKCGYIGALILEHEPNNK